MSGCAEVKLGDNPHGRLIVTLTSLLRGQLLADAVSYSVKEALQFLVHLSLGILPLSVFV